MVESIDYWFWAASLSMLLALQPFFRQNEPLLRAIHIFSIGLAIIAGAIALTMIGSLSGSLLATLSVWHTISLGRLYKVRHSMEELTRRVSTTILWMLPLFSISIIFVIYEDSILASDGLEYIQILLASLSFSVAVLVFLTSVWNVLSRKIRRSPVVSEQQKPTVTLAIPARNENHALSEALTAAVESDYPKLEVLVLDDCSQDRTSEIIKEFAHKGVRFVQGSEPASGWLGKNRAYRILAEEASGDVILFSGVDVHYSKSSISRLIDHMEGRKLNMISIMPRRRGIDIGANVLQPLRYLSQAVLPIALFGRQPVLSSCWAISRKSLKKVRGFTPVKGEIVPEQYFARKFAETHGYDFIISNKWLGISTRKKLSSQIETATRTLYPRARQEMALVVSLIIVGLFLFVIPYALAVKGLLAQEDLSGAHLLNVAAAFIFSAATVVFTLRNHPQTALISIISLPFIVVSYSAAAIWSVLKYEFGTVDWKGRNVCLPVLVQKRPKHS